MTHVLAAAAIAMTIMAGTEIEIGTGTGTGTGTVDGNVTASASANVMTGIDAIGIGTEAGIEVGMMVVEKGSVCASADLLADSTLRGTLTLSWASARAGGRRRSRGREAGITSTSLGQAETGAHEAHNTKEGICDNDNIRSPV